MCRFNMIGRPTALLGLQDSVYLNIITINIGELPAQDNGHDSDIEGFESNNHNAKRPVYKDGTQLNGKQHQELLSSTCR